MLICKFALKLKNCFSAPTSFDWKILNDTANRSDNNELLWHHVNVYSAGKTFLTNINENQFKWFLLFLSFVFNSMFTKKHMRFSIGFDDQSELDLVTP